MRLFGAVFLLVLLAALVGLDTQPAWAHPLLLQASPAPNALLRSAPSQVQLLFSEDLTSSASRLLVVDHLHHTVTEGRSALVPGNSRELAVRLRSLRPGSYLVSWTVVSADDGHVVHGSYLFSVKVRSPGLAVSGAAPSGQGFPDVDTLAGLLAHWLQLLAAVTWFGSAAFSVFVLPSGDRQPEAWRQHELLVLRRLLRSSLVILIATNAIALLQEAHELVGGDWSAALSTSTVSPLLTDQHGQLWIAQQIVALLALASTLPIPTRRHVPQWLAPAVAEGGSWHVAPWVQIPLGAFFLYAIAASGHAASADVGVLRGSHLVTAAVAVDLLHLLAVALWLGGQIYIFLVLIPTLRPTAPLADGRSFLELLDRFSPIAYGSVAAFVLTGPFNAKIHIPSWSAFFATTYGRALAIKMVLIAMMMLISAFTVYTLRPRIRQALDSGAGETVGRSLLQALVGWLRLNPVLGAGVLLATSVMFFYPVPESFSQSAAAGPTWRSAGLPGVTIHLLAFGHRHRGFAFAATEQGVYRLQGATWQRVLPVQSVWSVALSNDDSTLVAGDESGDVSVSGDAGATWRHALVTSQGVFSVSIRPGKPHWLLAGAGQGLFLSRDGGSHWERRP